MGGTMNAQWIRNDGRPRVVITGLGAITPHGQGVEAAWRGVVGGRSTIGPITRFDARSFPVRFAAEAPDPGLSEELPEGLSPLAQDLKGRLSVAAAREALNQARLPAKMGRRLGVCVGSEAARPELSLVAARLRSGELPSQSELERMAPHAATRLVAGMAGALGPQSTVSTACTSSSQAIGEGLLRIRRGEADAMLVGGVDVLVDPIMVVGFAKLGALSTRNEDPTRASRPFDLHRDGFVLGEGAGFLVIETLEHAMRRAAPILAELSGFGCSCNAWRITDSPPDGRGAAQSMELALRDAGLEAEDIGYVNAHGTSTPMNDTSEARGILRALGDHGSRVPVSSTKSTTGHLVAACGAVEAIFCVNAVRDGVLPPSAHIEHPDPTCPLTLVRDEAQRVDLRHALTNAFGFGGSNGSLVISRMEA
jgi:3-oxoacyl-[acyl-carrier-protein] synthase II